MTADRARRAGPASRQPNASGDRWVGVEQGESEKGELEQGEKERRRLWDRTEPVVGALIDVHRHLGPGLLESAYEACLCRELELRGLAFERQVALPVSYKGLRVDCGYRVDLVVQGGVLVELKAVEHLLPIHVAQVITYLRLSDLPVALLVTFNVRVLKHGLRRLWLSSPSSSPSLPVPPLPSG
jgi:GxxExxY protein